MLCHVMSCHVMSCHVMSCHVVLSCMHACMYACIYLSMYAYVCMHVCMHACVYAWMYAFMYVCMHVCVHVCIYAYSIHVYMHVCIYACMYACMRACMYVCLHGCMYACLWDTIRTYILWLVHTGASLKEWWLEPEFGNGPTTSKGEHVSLYGRACPFMNLPLAFSIWTCIDSLHPKSLSSSDNRWKGAPEGLSGTLFFFGHMHMSAYRISVSLLVIMLLLFDEAPMSIDYWFLSAYSDPHLPCLKHDVCRSNGFKSPF